MIIGLGTGFTFCHVCLGVYSWVVVCCLDFQRVLAEFCPFTKLFGAYGHEGMLVYVQSREEVGRNR